MTATAIPRERYIDKIEKHLLKKYPGMRFEVEHLNDLETILFCFPAEPVAETYDFTSRAGNIVTDALVDSGYQIYVMSGE